MNQNPKLLSKLSETPKQPGVYRFLNKDGGILYVGKAKNLKNRIGQYLNGHDDRPQLPHLMREAADFDYTVVSNELESLFLENTLIKKYLPPYNIMLRDDKNYAFICIDYSCEIPQIGYARKIDPEALKIKGQGSASARPSPAKPSRDGSRIKYFGPYSAAYKIRNTLNLVRRIFPYCSSKQVSSRPCFYYYLHRCPGVCIGKISLDEYKLQLDRICWFLSGNTGKIVQQLKSEMKTAATQRQFEAAARLRDQLRSLELLQERQNVILSKPVSWDVISLAAEAGYACVNLFKVREGKMLDKENFVFEIGGVVGEDIIFPPPNGRMVAAPTAQMSIMQTFLEQYYLETSDAPKIVYTQTAAEDGELIEHIIKSRFEKKVEILTPQKGKPLELVNLGITNAEEYLKNWLNSQAGHLDKINTALEQLKTVLNLEKIPQRIECYDISNIQGSNAVGSMVVFENGLPKKSQYRKFKIRGLKTPDDFAMMKEMLQRRFARSVIARSAADEAILSRKKIASPSDALGTRNDKTAWPLPDLIVIDGGKGQLNAALEVLEKLQITNYKLQTIGLAKRIEEIFLPNQPEAIILSHDQPALQLLQRLRDEAHRFGITYHRKLRSKQAVKSALDDIPGIGPKTKKLLKQKFGTVASIRKTPYDELAKEVGERVAQLIQQNL